MSRLFKCVLRCKIKWVPDRVEYLRAKNDDQLINMFERCENLEGSMYYGYKCNEVITMRIKNFPDTKIVELECDFLEGLPEK